MALTETLATGGIGALTGALGAVLALFMNERRVRRQYRLDLSAEALARELLTHPKWRLRNFTTIKRHLGGFADDELRQILVRAGAVRFETEDEGEWWGLVRRNRRLLAGKEIVRARERRPVDPETNATILRNAGPVMPAVLPPNLKLPAPSDAPRPSR